MELIQQLIEAWVAFGKENQAIAGAMTLGALGLGGWALNTMPKKFADVFMSQVTTSMMMDNADWGGDAKSQFHRFMMWYIKHGLTNLSRRYSLESNGELGVGDGRHYFLFKGRLFWFSKYRLASEGVGYEKREIMIRGLTRNQNLLDELKKQFELKPSPRTLGMHRWQKRGDTYNSTGGRWQRTATVGMRSLETIAVDQEKLQEIKDGIDFFLKNKKFYTDRGISYKFFLIMHGEPGTGKTSLAKALASLYNRDIYIINFKEINSESLPRAYESVPSGSLILTEDFDSAEATWSREYLKARYNRLQEGENHMGYTSTGQGADLETILNCTDGIVEYDDIIMVGTTNHLDRIDPAFYRPGRGDLVIEIPKLRHEDMVDYLIQVGGEGMEELVRNWLNGRRWEPMTGSALQARFTKYHGNWMQLLESLPYEGPGFLEVLTNIAHKLEEAK